MPECAHTNLRFSRLLIRRLLNRCKVCANQDESKSGTRQTG